MWTKSDLHPAGAEGDVFLAPGSMQQVEGTAICSAHDAGKAFLMLKTAERNRFFDDFEGEISEAGAGFVKLAPLSGANAKK